MNAIYQCTYNYIIFRIAKATRCAIARLAALNSERGSALEISCL